MIMSELESDIKHTFKDPTQYGNTKGSSTTYYLMEFTHEAYTRSNDIENATTAIITVPLTIPKPLTLLTILV